MKQELREEKNTDDPDLSAILGAFGIELPKKQYSYGELQRIKTKIKIF